MTHDWLQIKSVPPFLSFPSRTGELAWPSISRARTTTWWRMTFRPLAWMCRPFGQRVCSNTRHKWYGVWTQCTAKLWKVAQWQRLPIYFPITESVLLGRPVSECRSITKMHGTWCPSDTRSPYAAIWNYSEVCCWLVRFVVLITII